jgi:hypothetical protein
MSFKPEVRTVHGTDFYGNSLAFATREEAQAHVKDLERRWLLVVDTRVVESDEPVSHTWANGQLGMIGVPA